MSVDSVRRSAQRIAKPVAHEVAKATTAAAKKIAEAKRLHGHDGRSSFEPHRKAPVALHGNTHRPSSATSRTAGGTNDDSIGTNDDSIGTNDDSIGTNDDSIGTNDDSIGTNDDSIGGVGQLSSGEQN